MTQELIEALAALESAIRATGAGVMDNLGAGLAEGELRDALTPLGMEPSEELIAWFGWHNGLIDIQRRQGGSWLVAWTPLSLHQALESRETFEPGPEEWQLPETFLPIAESGGPFAVVADCTPPAGSTTTVKVYDPGGGLEAYHAVPSLTEMVNLWRQALEEGWRIYNPDRDSWDRGSQPPPDIRRTQLT